MSGFVTDFDLQHLQQTKDKYFNLCLADIFMAELECSNNQTILESAKFIYHRLIDPDKNIWEIKFSDGSFCLLKMTNKGQYVKGFPMFDYYDNVDRYFSDIPK